MTGRTRALGLALLVVCLTMAAAVAPVAQAGEFTLNGGTFTSKGLASESISGVGAGGKLLVPGLALTFVCAKDKLTGTILLGGVVHATVLFEECGIEGNKFCKLYETKAKMESEVEPGFIVTSGLGELVLMEGKHYLLISSGAGILTVLYLTKATKGCTLPLEEAKTGSFVLEAPTALIPSVKQTLTTIPQAELEKLFPSDILKYGNQKGWLDSGTLSLELSGANKGKTWGGE